MPLIWNILSNAFNILMGSLVLSPLSPCVWESPSGATQPRRPISWQPLHTPREKVSGLARNLSNSLRTTGLNKMAADHPTWNKHENSTLESNKFTSTIYLDIFLSLTMLKQNVHTDQYPTYSSVGGLMQNHEPNIIRTLNGNKRQPAH